MLCENLKRLATDGNKHRAKNDRRKQRSIFREVLHYIEVRQDSTVDFSVSGANLFTDVLLYNKQIRQLKCQPSQSSTKFRIQ